MEIEIVVWEGKLNLQSFSIKFFSLAFWRFFLEKNSVSNELEDNVNIRKINLK